MKKLNRFLAVFLMVTVMITGLPVTTFAEENTARTQSLSEKEGISPETKKQVEKEVKLLGEVKEKREKNSKQFLTEDKTYLAAVYPSAVHYKEGTEWKDIDNSLLDSTDEDQQPVLENKQNSVKVKLAKDAKSKKLVRVKKGQFELSWALENAASSEVQKVPMDTKLLNQIPEGKKKTFLPN